MLYLGTPNFNVVMLTGKLERISDQMQSIFRSVRMINFLINYSRSDIFNFKRELSKCMDRACSGVVRNVKSNAVCG
jgi:hypothetical protein